MEAEHMARAAKHAKARVQDQGGGTNPVERGQGVSYNWGDWAS